MKIFCPLLLLSLVACSTSGSVADPSTFSGMSPTSSHYPGLLTHIDADGYAFVWAPYAKETEIAPEFVAVVRLPSDVYRYGASGTTLSPRAAGQSHGRVEEGHVLLECVVARRLDRHDADALAQRQLAVDGSVPRDKLGLGQRLRVLLHRGVDGKVHLRGRGVQPDAKLPCDWNGRRAHECDDALLLGGVAPLSFITKTVVSLH